jgi:hypothetical protein
MGAITYKKRDPAAFSNALRKCDECGKVAEIHWQKCPYCKNYHEKHWTEIDGMNARLLLDGQFG